MAEISESVFEVLRSAVNLARNEQIQKVTTLKVRLLNFYPGREEDVNKAIFAWAQYVQARGSSTLVGRPE